MPTTPPPFFPPLLSAFLLTLAMSFLLGLGLREYYLLAQKSGYFGSTRTCTLIGILGFVLFQIQPSGWIYLGGLLALAGLMCIYYLARTAQHQVGLIGILIAFLSYLIGPISLSFPDWFLILFTITALFVLNAKEKINLLTQKLVNEEIISLGKFLVLSGVILPLTPKTPIAEFIPVSFYQTWLAVVVISGISYLGYLMQTYILKGRGLLLTGAMGGVYSSTATTVVLARQSNDFPAGPNASAAAIVLATAMMYLRLLVVVGIFRLSLAAKLLPIFLGLALLSAGLAYWLQRDHESFNHDWRSASASQNPLEITAAILFALTFVAINAATQFIFGLYADHGLLWMSFFAGFADIDPFILSLLQGKFTSLQEILFNSIIISAASNNLLKAMYALILGERRAGRMAACVLTAMAGLTVFGGFFGK